MKDLSKYQVWFVTGSQHLYGEEALNQVEKDSRKMVSQLADNDRIPVELIWKPVLTNSQSIERLILEANQSDECVGIIGWMHTFSPAKMWIAGLNKLQKPFAHLHTQYNREIPWSEIDMDFMNLNQSAHGGREFGYMATRMDIKRKVIVGYWQDEQVIDELVNWIRAACGLKDSQEASIARFGDNMRRVAVTEGDKVAAQMQLGYSVDGYGLGDLMEYVDQISDHQIDSLVEEYRNQYRLSQAAVADNDRALKEAARIELGLKGFLEDKDYQGFTTTFENLHGLEQLPGLSVQRLMASGYGFGAEGDWKTAALVRTMKVMSAGLPGGTSFMEDYTYDFTPDEMKVLGAHMLEVCESIAPDNRPPSLEVHPLSIGDKKPPARLVFTVPEGSAIQATLVEFGDHFRLIVNKVQVVEPESSLPKLPVARALWKPEPDLKTAARAWILAGGAHHSGFSQAISSEVLEDFAEMTGIEFLIIDKDTEIRDFKDKLRWNKLYYRLNS